MNGKLDITALKNAVTALRKSINVYKENHDKDIDLSDALRSGVIQNFEVVYELSWKFMKRWLEINVSPDIVLGVTRKEFYRIAAENLLIADVTKWWDFHEARNKTSHIYDCMLAVDVLDTAMEFLPYANDFLGSLEQKI
jgi:nucleotidyltransferase substrate binding protein (TIGR01987 family)